MSSKLQASISSRETAISDLSRASSVSDAKTNCCKSFLSCFRITHKKDSLEHIIDNNVKEYDYVVEKLVVKRVPFVLLSAPKNTLEPTVSPENKNNFNKDTLQMLPKLNTIYSSASGTQSLLYYADKFHQNMISLNASNKCSHFDTNTALLNKRSKNYVPSDDYHARITELMNAMSSLHPDLKEHERPPKDLCSLKISKNKSITSTRISLKALLNRNNEHQKQKAFKSQISIQESFPRKKEFRNIDPSEVKSKNDQNIYDLNQMECMTMGNLQDNSASKAKQFVVQSSHKITCNSTNLASQNMKDCESDNNHLQCNHQSLIDEFKSLSENTANSTPLNTLLRWNIIVKQYKPKTYSSATAQKISKYFNIN